MKGLDLNSFDTLFALNKNGKIIVFTVAAIQDGDVALLASHTGQLFGKMTEKRKIIAKGVNIGKANETTPYQQAMNLAQSMWNTKRNEGYKSIEDLSLKAVSEDLISDVNLFETELKHKAVQKLHEMLRIKFNTDTNWRPLPMLAEKYKTHGHKIKFPCIVQPKLNGARSPVQYDKDLQQVVFASRGGKTFKVDILSAELEPFFKMGQHLILDGELYCHGKHLNEIMSAISGETLVPDWIEYHIYDTISKEPQMQRIEDIRIYHNLIKNQYGATRIKLVSHDIAHSHDEIKALHDQYVAMGYEGAIVRDMKAKYAISFRDECLIKVKSYEDAEFRIVSCNMDPYEGIDSFVFVLENNTNDKRFEAKPTGTREERQIWNDRIAELEGLEVTGRFQERSLDDIPLQCHVRHKDSQVLMDMLK